jgi:hypothetical protein
MTELDRRTVTYVNHSEVRVATGLGVEIVGEKDTYLHLAPPTQKTSCRDMLALRSGFCGR